MSTLLRMKNIQKSFSGVKALSNAQFELREGEVHALIGENGAGKSTLIKILGGIYQKDGGEIYIEDKKVEINGIGSARAYGISIIHQELMLLPQMTVAENIFLGREDKKHGILQKKAMLAKTEALLRRFSLNIDPAGKVGALSIAQQQIIEIVRAISFGAKIIVMDEPTSSLSDKEVHFLFQAIERLKREHVGIIYISHRLSELAIADRVTVMRDGAYIATFETKKTTRAELITKMVGRELTSYYERNHTPADEVLLEVRHYSDGERVKDASFSLHKGEVLGFAGLIGAERSELMECIFGLSKKKQGDLLLKGKKMCFRDVGDAMANGVALIPEDRKVQGLYFQQDVSFNMTIEVLRSFLRMGTYKSDIEKNIVREYVEKMSIKISSPKQLVSNLSGGNQQKVLIGRWIATRPDILILDEPTRGVDVGAKAEIYHIINELAAKGIAIIMVSSELPEILGMSDRVVVMSDGYSVGELDSADATQEKIMAMATTEM